MRPACHARRAAHFRREMVLPEPRSGDAPRGAWCAGRAIGDEMRDKKISATGGNGFSLRALYADFRARLNGRESAAPKATDGWYRDTRREVTRAAGSWIPRRKWFGR
jgi:hypothetical protein